MLCMRLDKLLFTSKLENFVKSSVDDYKFFSRLQFKEF